MANDMVNDNRFEVIGKAKEHLLEATNIDTSPDEMAVLDSFLFRCWQMGWLKQYDRAGRYSADGGQTMRLIDAGAVRRWLADWQYGEAPNPGDTEEDREKAMIKYEILDIILSGLDDPHYTINAEPVRHGLWIEDSLVSTNGGTYGVRRCSLCGAYYQDVGYGWNYCPECGARMGTEE